MLFGIEDLKSLKKTELSMSIVQIVAGIVFMLLPGLLPNGVVKAVAIIAIVVGGIMLGFMFTRPKELNTWKSYTLPVVIIAIGFYTFIQTEQTIQIISYGVGIVTILKGIGDLLNTTSPIEKNKRIALGVVSIILGIIIIVLSGDSRNINLMFSYYIGIDLIIQGCMGLYVYSQINKAIENLSNEV